MNIENNKFLFLAYAGLTMSGYDGYDRSDADVCRIAEMLHAAHLPNHVKEWFAGARTGQVAVNPYWPRGSCLAAACFFVDNDRFDQDSYFRFLESTGNINDPVSLEAFKKWISGIAPYLRFLDEHPSIPPIWNEYCRIIESRSAGWSKMLAAAAGAARGFFGGKGPQMVFNPNIFTPYSADFVRIGSKIITISATPDVETMLHETMHTAIAECRAEITAFSKKHGLGAFAAQAKMLELGYMENPSTSSVTHVIEECFVRALSVVLSGGNDERLQAHARFGFVGVPILASLIHREAPTCQNLEGFVDKALSLMGK